MTEEIVAPLTSLPALTEDELNDAAFRAQDLGWAVLLAAFTKRQEAEGLTYKALGERIGRSKQQVQRWLSSPFGMSTRTLGLLAEGLDMDLGIVLEPRTEQDPRSNYMHPSERAKSERRHVALHARAVALSSQSASHIVSFSQSLPNSLSQSVIGHLEITSGSAHSIGSTVGQRELEHG